MGTPLQNSKWLVQKVRNNEPDVYRYFQCSYLLQHYDLNVLGQALLGELYDKNQSPAAICKKLKKKFSREPYISKTPNALKQNKITQKPQNKPQNTLSKQKLSQTYIKTNFLAKNTVIPCVAVDLLKKYHGAQELTPELITALAKNFSKVYDRYHPGADTLNVVSGNDLERGNLHCQVLNANYLVYLGSYNGLAIYPVLVNRKKMRVDVWLPKGLWTDLIGPMQRSSFKILNALSKCNGDIKPFKSNVHEVGNLHRKKYETAAAIMIMIARREIPPKTIDTQYFWDNVSSMLSEC